MKVIAIAAAAALLIGAAPLPTVFGIQLGAPVTLPACVHTKLAAGVPGSGYALEQPAWCIEAANPQRPTRATIRVPVAEMPTIVAAPFLGGTVIDGRIEAISAPTLGYGSTDAIVTTLSQKFGKPTSRQADPKTIAGIPVVGTEVRWIGDGFEVEYHSIGNEITSGWMQVSTAAGRAAEAAQDARADAARTPL